MRVALGAEGVSIWSSEIFGSGQPSRLRLFLARAFAVSEVQGVELRRAKSFGRIRHGAVPNRAHVWQKLSRVLRSPVARAEANVSRETQVGSAEVDATLLFLDLPEAGLLRITRIGRVLSTWRLQRQGERTLVLSHPVLRNRRDIAYRLEEELGAIAGVEHFRTSTISHRVSIQFDPQSLTVERLARELEKAWPRLLEGLDGPPSRRRLWAASGLVGLAYAGQYLVPAVKPFALAGVTLYSSPNVINAARELARGRVGLYALYSMGLGFMLASGLPFTASVMQMLMQLWPQLSHRQLVRSQRRLFALQRRRPTSVRLIQPGGVDIEVNSDELRAGDRVLVRSGETVPVDGVVEDGSAAVIAQAALGGGEVEDRSAGDAISAGAYVRHGSLTIRVERAGADTSASYFASLLPRGALVGLPSSLEAERIANRNAKPAIALSAATLALTQTLFPAQVLIRPDYATAPRLSAQLSTLRALAHGLRQGVVFRNPAALDRVASARLIIIDDSADLERRRVELAAVQSASGVEPELVLGHVVAALADVRTEQALALAGFVSHPRILQPKVEALERHAGVTRYRDAHGDTIEIATAAYLAGSGIGAPQRFQTVLSRRAKHGGRQLPADTASAPPAPRPLWVVRNREVIGLVSFARSGEPLAKRLISSLRARYERVPLRIAYLARGEHADTRALARALGIDLAYGGLSPSAKVDVIRGLGQAALWIGDGADPEARDAIAASAVSLSVAPASRSPGDAADILLPQKGLSAVPAVIDIGRAHARRLEQDYRTVYATNLLGVAGALLVTLSPLQVGLLSNIGTGIVYTRHARALDLLASVTERSHAWLKRRA